MSNFWGAVHFVAVPLRQGDNIGQADPAPTVTPSATSLLSSLVPLKQGDNSNAIDEFCCEWSREAPRLWCRVGHKSQNESINKQSKNAQKTGG